jgi:hypothetical protein
MSNEVKTLIKAHRGFHTQIQHIQLKRMLNMSPVIIRTMFKPRTHFTVSLDRGKEHLDISVPSEEKLGETCTRLEHSPVKVPHNPLTGDNAFMFHPQERCTMILSKTSVDF